MPFRITKGDDREVSQQCRCHAMLRGGLPHPFVTQSHLFLLRVTLSPRTGIAPSLVFCRIRDVS